MSSYGLRLFDYEDKKYAYGVYKRLTPANQSYAVVVTLVDYVYVNNDSSLTFTNQETQANVVVSLANNLADVSQFQGANCIVSSGNANVESFSIFTRKPEGSTLSISNIELVAIADTYTLSSGKVALVVDGTIDVPVGNTTFVANSQVDTYSIGPRLTDTTLTGTGKVIVFNIA